jgi:uncharacterized protein
LQGTYAHLAVCQFWRVRAGLGEYDESEAAREYEHWRAHTAAAIETLANSGSLTPLGMRFTTAMRIAIAACSRTADGIASQGSPVGPTAQSRALRQSGRTIQE